MSPLHALSSSSSSFLHLSQPFRRSDPFSLSLPSKLRPLLLPFHAKKPLRAPAASASASSSSLDYLDDSDPPLPPAVRTFWRWMAEEGVISSTCPLRPAYVAEGLGLVARRDIAEDEIILKVPRRLWVNPDTVSASEIGYLCTDLKPWVQVALFLIREKLRPNSWWRFYVDILPETTNSTIYWCVLIRSLSFLGLN